MGIESLGLGDRVQEGGGLIYDVRGREVIHYHGGPITPVSAAVSAWSCRHAFVSFEHPGQVSVAAEVAQSFALDNGAYSAWRAGRSCDFSGYVDWVEEWMRHPGFDWALIPDVIAGDEQENDNLVSLWLGLAHGARTGVPVWHLHESLDRLDHLCGLWARVALGSSGDYAAIGSERWWARMNEAMEVACDDKGRPRVKLHGLRMLDPTIFRISRFPLLIRQT